MLRRIIKMGDSLGVTIPKEIIIAKNWKSNDKIDVEFKNIEDINVVFSYRCKKDNTVFDSSDEIPYCPICGEEVDIEDLGEENGN
jgi:antitoxin component of MazEF toxin-antitoxin module